MITDLTDIIPVPLFQSSSVVSLCQCRQYKVSLCISTWLVRTRIEGNFQIAIVWQSVSTVVDSRADEFQMNYDE